jgi:hypothetical protein
VSAVVFAAVNLQLLFVLFRYMEKGKKEERDRKEVRIINITCRAVNQSGRA